MGRKTPGAKKVKDPNRPKRSISAYFYFVAKEREECKKRGEDCSRVAEWTKAVSVKWKDVTPTQRKEFDALAAKDKARYEREMAAYGGKGAKRPKDPNKPKRPQTAYFLFLHDFRIKNKADFQYENGHKELIKAAGEGWNELSAANKKPYEERAAQLKVAYDKEMANYVAGGSTAKKQKTDNGAAAAVEDDDDDEEDEEEDEESD